MSELKRCPFCDKTLIADCKQFFIHPIVGCLMDGIPIKNDAESLKHWNTRKPMQNIVERLEETKTKSYVTGITSNPYEFGACHAMNDAIKIVKEEGEINDNT